MVIINLVGNPSFHKKYRMGWFCVAGGYWGVSSRSVVYTYYTLHHISSANLFLTEIYLKVARATLTSLIFNSSLKYIPIFLINACT